MAAMGCAAIRTMALIEPGMNRSTENITVAVTFRFDAIAQGRDFGVDDRQAPPNPRPADSA